MYTKCSGESKRWTEMHGASVPFNTNTNPSPDIINLLRNLETSVPLNANTNPSLDAIILPRPPRVSRNSTMDAFVFLSLLKGVPKGAKAPAPSMSPTPPDDIFLQALNLITEAAKTHFLSRKNPIDDVMALCSKTSEIKQIKATVQNSKKGATIAGGAAFLGGLLGGPPGIFIGAALGGAVGWWMTSGKFLSLRQIIMEMPPQKKSKLYSEVKAALGNLYWADLEQLIYLVMKDSSLQMKVYNIVSSFLKKELGAKVVYG